VSESLEFDQIYEYNTLKSGITVPVKLSFGENQVAFTAKIDTGSSHCIFERKHGQQLELEIENGIELNFNTAAGDFRAFGHELTLTVLGIENVSTVYFAESDYFDRNVLGRIGWLDRVKLGLIEREGKLFLSEYKK
jgi:predicted aspartyl protease